MREDITKLIDNPEFFNKIPEKDQLSFINASQPSPEDADQKKQCYTGHLVQFRQYIQRLSLPVLLIMSSHPQNPLKHDAGSALVEPEQERTLAILMNKLYVYRQPCLNALVSFYHQEKCHHPEHSIYSRLDYYPEYLVGRSSLHKPPRYNEVRNLNNLIEFYFIDCSFSRQLEKLKKLRKEKPTKNHTILTEVIERLSTDTSRPSLGDPKIVSLILFLEDKILELSNYYVNERSKNIFCSKSSPAGMYGLPNYHEEKMRTLRDISTSLMVYLSLETRAQLINALIERIPNSPQLTSTSAVEPLASLPVPSAPPLQEMASQAIPTENRELTEKVCENSQKESKINQEVNSSSSFLNNPNALFNSVPSVPTGPIFPAVPTDIPIAIATPVANNNHHETVVTAYAYRPGSPTAMS